MTRIDPGEMTQRQIWIPRTGGPGVLEVREGPVPEPREGEIRIRVAAAGVNFADILARMGLYPDAPDFPAVVGYEVAGEVEKLGPGVDQIKVGDRVLALTGFGGYSERVVTRTRSVFPMPPTLSYEKAAAIPVNYLTAWLMLVWLGNVRQGDRVLIHAAAGGVGQAAVQICRWRGARIFGTASPSKHERLTELGVAHCIDYTTQDFEAEVMRVTEGEGVDIVLDAVGGPSLRKSYRCLAPLGRLFVYGASSAAPGKRRSWLRLLGFLLRTPRFHPIRLMQENRGVLGVNLGHLWRQADLLSRMLGEILHLVEQGILDPVVDRTFSFDEAAQAHAYIQDRKNFGKVILVP